MGSNSKSKNADETAGKRPRSRAFLLRVGVIGAAVLVGLVAWLLTRGDDDSSEPASGGPRIVTESELADAAGDLSTPLYWAGPVPETEIELTELPGGGAQVRYLPANRKGPAAALDVLTVGSYPVADAARMLDGYAKLPGAVIRRGGEVVSNQRRPTSVYFADPAGGVQVEVYDPDPRQAMTLALSGTVEPVP